MPRYEQPSSGIPFAADSSEPDRPQAVKAGVAPPLLGFGLDGLMPRRFGLSKQTTRFTCVR